MLSVRLCVLLLSVIYDAKGNVNSSFKKLRTPEQLAENIHDFINGVDGNITDDCYVALNQYADGLLAEELWALKMFDSASKLPAGIIPAEETSLGNFDQCLISNNSTKNWSIYGKYCFGDLKITAQEQDTESFSNTTSTNDNASSVPIQIATCLPNACSVTDIHLLYSSFGFKYNIADIDCQTKDSRIELDTLGTIGIVVLGSIVALMIVSTVYDVQQQCRNEKKMFCCIREQQNQLQKSFSVVTNFKKLLATTTNPNQITCFHGIRAISVMMIILIHRQGALHSVDFHSTSTPEFYSRFTDLFLIALRTAVDTFLMMSGCLVSYGFMAASAKGVTFNLFSHWFHRYVRLTPPLAAVILLSVSLIKHLGSGPRWLTLMQRDLENPCKEYWWSSLLYIQNYINPKAICLTPTWYLSVDTQLYFLSPILLLLFWKYPKLKTPVLGSLVIGLPLIVLYVAWTEEHRTFNDYDGDLVRWNNFFTKIYFPTHARASSWLIGFALGYVVYANKESKFDVPVKGMIRNSIVVIVWIAILAVTAFCIFGAPLVVMTIGNNRIFNSFFLAFGGPLWALAVSCLIFGCVHGFSGPINWILSNQLMQVLSKLSYSMYLVHEVVLFFDIYRTRTVPVFENFDFAYTFWSDYMVSMFVAVFWVLAFEFPILTIEKAIWPRKTKE